MESDDSGSTSSPTIWQLVTRPDIVRRSAMTSAIVGTVLTVINQGDAMMGAEFNLYKCLLTYLVPYFVATYGAVSALRSIRQQPQ